MELEVLLLLLLMVVMIGTFASTVAVGLGLTFHIVVAAADSSGGDVGGMEGSTDTASGPIANHRCHNVQLPDCSRRLLIVYRANAADDRGRDLRFGITFCSYDCTMLLMLLLLLLLVLLTVTLIITAPNARASLGSGDQIPSLLLLVVLLTFRGILLAGRLRAVASCRCRCACCRSRRTVAAAAVGLGY